MKGEIQKNGRGTLISEEGKSPVQEKEEKGVGTNYIKDV